MEKKACPKLKYVMFLQTFDTHIMSNLERSLGGYNAQMVCEINVNMLIQTVSHYLGQKPLNYGNKRAHGTRYSWLWETIMKTKSATRFYDSRLY